jgi:hypothetical protein
MFRRALPALVVMVLACCAPRALAQPGAGTSFTYQGQLSLNGSAANASADFRFRLYDAATAGTQIGSQISVPGLSLANGLFTVNLDFGVNPYTPNAARYLEIDVRSPAAQGVYTTLTPRQALTPTPFSLNTRGITVDANGAVGIGTVPANRLHVLSNGDSQCTLNIDSGATAAQVSQLRLSDRGTAAWTLNKFADGSFSVRESAVTADRLTILPGGNVGIGTGSPGANLDVRDNMIITSANSNVGRTLLDFDANGPRIALESGSLGGLVYISKSQVAPTRGGQMLIGNPSGSPIGGIQATGPDQTTFAATIKNFWVPNPDDATTDIWYACVEGPEAAMYVRGTAHLTNGRATVSLPRHFAAMLSSIQTMTVQVTPSGLDCRGLAVTRKGADSFDVGELLQGQSNGAFDWEAKAVRRGFEQYKVVRPKNWMSTLHDGE